MRALLGLLILPLSGCFAVGEVKKDFTSAYHCDDISVERWPDDKALVVMKQSVRVQPAVGGGEASTWVADKAMIDANRDRLVDPWFFTSHAVAGVFTIDGCGKHVVYTCLAGYYCHDVVHGVDSICAHCQNPDDEFSDPRVAEAYLWNRFGVRLQELAGTGVIVRAVDATLPQPLQRHDIIIAVGGQSVSTMNQLAHLAFVAKSVPVTFRRGEQTQSAALTASERTQWAQLADGSRLGIALAAGNMIVTLVGQGGAADGKLLVNDIIVSADGKPATNAADFLGQVLLHDDTPLQLVVRRNLQDVPVSVSLNP